VLLDMQRHFPIVRYRRQNPKNFETKVKKDEKTAFRRQDSDK